MDGFIQSPSKCALGLGRADPLHFLSNQYKLEPSMLRVHNSGDYYPAIQGGAIHYMLSAGVPYKGLVCMSSLPLSPGVDLNNVLIMSYLSRLIKMASSSKLI